MVMRILFQDAQGLGNKNDVLIAISTNGNSENVIKACLVAKKCGNNFHWIYRAKKKSKLSLEVDIFLY